MGYTTEQQRLYLNAKRLQTHPENLVICLDCGLSFIRVGGHVVQVHGYSSAKEYYRAHGLSKKEGSTPQYRQKMHEITKSNGTEKFLVTGVHTRFHTGGTHGTIVKHYWKCRRERHPSKKNSPQQV